MKIVQIGYAKIPLYKNNGILQLLAQQDQYNTFPLLEVVHPILKVASGIK